MSEEIYTLVAMAARYWFLLLIVLIVLRSFSWLRKDSRARKKRVKRLPDAGFVGELVVLAGSEEMPVGTALPLPKEGTLGSLRSCDVVVPVEGVLGKHLDFRFVSGKGLFVQSYYKSIFSVDGQEVEKFSKPLLMYHGSRLSVGDAVLRMRLFVGVEAPRPGALQPMPVQAFTEPVMPVYQDMYDDQMVYHQRTQDWQTDRFAPLRDTYVAGYEEEYIEDDDAEYAYAEFLEPGDYEYVDEVLPPDADERGRWE